jgi:hypothetical protein
MFNRQPPGLASIGDILFPWALLVLFMVVTTTCKAQDRGDQPGVLQERTFARYMPDQDRSVYMRFEKMEEVGATITLWAFFHNTGTCRPLPTSDVEWIPSENVVRVGDNRWDLHYNLKKDALRLETPTDTIEYKQAPIGERVRQKCESTDRT